MAATNVAELRKYNRFVPDDLFAVIGETVVHVENISAAGICLRRPNVDFTNRNVQFQIAPVVDDKLAMHRAVEILGHIVGTTDDKVRIVFSAVNYELANLIQHYRDKDNAGSIASN
jgi:hypothetical protein